MKYQDIIRVYDIEPTIHIAHSFSDPLSVAREYVEALQKAIEVAEKWKNDQKDDD